MSTESSQDARSNAGTAPVAVLKSALCALLLGWAPSALGQDLPDKSAPSERNTDLEFDYALTNTGKRGNYRIVRLDTGQVLMTGQVGTDFSPLTTLQNQFAASGLLPGTPVGIQVQQPDGSWSTVDNIRVHYPPEPSDSQRYLDDAGYRGNFTVPDVAAASSSPTPAPTASPSARPSPTGSAAAAGTSRDGGAHASPSASSGSGGNTNR
jgi:hypothetical protein